MLLSITQDGHHLLIEGTSAKDAYELGRMSAQMENQNLYHTSECADSEDAIPYLSIPLTNQIPTKPTLNMAD
jgi:hypothetical protein